MKVLFRVGFCHALTAVDHVRTCDKTAGRLFTIIAFETIRKIIDTLKTSTYYGAVPSYDSDFSGTFKLHPDFEALPERPRE